MTAKQILQKKGAFKAEMDRMMPREQSDALWQKFLAKGYADTHTRQNISGSGDLSDTEG